MAKDTSSSKTVILGVTGSIAAYKAAELASMMVKRGFQLNVVMTPAAAQFITPLTMQTISRNRVHLEMFALQQQWTVEHISLADRADLVLVAPASADIIAKLAAGIADDLLTATILATKAPVLIVPAMNEGMYLHPISQRNRQILSNYGYYFMEPEEGRLACGTVGKGRFPAGEKIIKEVERILYPGDFSGKRLLVTAGPTREPLDPVRFLTNYSSGKMGYAIAAEGVSRGAEVTLVSGPTDLHPPAGVDLVSVTTAAEMWQAVVDRFDLVDVVIKAAAVADYRPAVQETEKIKKGSETLLLKLERTEDILQYLGERKKKQVLVGFAAETEHLVEHAKAKLTEKHLDLLVANNLKEKGAGFGVDTNVATLFYADGRMKQLTKMTKRELARHILDAVEQIIVRTKGGGE